MTVEVFSDLEQGSPEWFAKRAGRPTASCFSDILAKGEGKTRRTYMRKLAAEIITGEVGESYKSFEMERGQLLEGQARNLYAFVNDEEPLERVGFVLNDGVGWSPDSVIGAKGAVEIKTQRADLLIETLLKNEFPPEHRPQCQGGLWVGEREWIDLVVYWPKMPLFVKRCYRDEVYIKALADAVKQFKSELAELVTKIQHYGLAEAA